MRVFSDKELQIKEAAEADLVTFIRLIHPKTLLGSIHEDLCRWWTRQDARSHQIALLPRDHQKSRMIAYRCVQRITQKPDSRILYISSTANLAEKQLKFMKDILTSDIYRHYWPEMVNKEEGKRERWTQSEVSVDHPLRAEEGVRDPTIFTGGLTTSLTGLHCDVAVLDDVVVFENAYTEEGRNKTKTQYSLLSSIEAADAEEWIVGTRYDPRDLYNDVMEMVEELFNDEGEIIGSDPIYEVFEKAVEDRGDGTGQFVWPRQRRDDGKWFGFDRQVLSRKRGKYLNKAQFRAQYYNNPNDPDSDRISHDKFQYYNKKDLTRDKGLWYHRGKRLNIAASVDFAYSLLKPADYTAIVVAGVDADGYYYVLDIARFKTDKISVYFQEILNLHNRWDFRKLRAEVTAAQKAIVQELKDSYIRPHGLALSVDEHKPTRHDGSKEERISATLEPRYDNLSIWHYRGGNCQILEDELVLTHPPHDDVKDALAATVDVLVVPSKGSQVRKQNKIVFHNRFGGVAHG